MVFYNIPLKCYVVVKVVNFVPEFAGKLNFYVTAADKLLRGEGGNPSIGLLVCRSKDDTVVEDLLATESFGCHPCVNTATLKLRFQDFFEKFVPATGHECREVVLRTEE